MKHKLAAVAITAAVAALATSSAFADDNSWYVGIGGGSAVLSFDNSFSSSAIAGAIENATGQPATASGSMNTTHGAFDVYFGYNLTKYFGLEFAYYDLGRVDGNYTANVGTTSIPITETYRVNSRSLAATGRYPIWSGLSLIGKVGASDDSVWTRTCAAVFTASPCANVSNHGFTPMAGGGLQYQFNPNFSLRTMYTYLGDVGKSTTTGKATAGLATVDVQVNF